MLRETSEFVSPFNLEALVLARYASYFPGKWELFASREFHSVFQRLSYEVKDNSLANPDEVPHADTGAVLDALRRILNQADIQGGLSLFPPIKVDEDGLIVDGMKRMAVAISRGYELVEVEIVKKGRVGNRQNHIIRSVSGIDGRGSNPDLEALVLEYSKIKSDLRAMVLFSGSKGYERKIEELTSQVGQVVLSKVFELTDSGLMRLIEIAYSTNDWWWSSSLSKKIKKEKASGHRPPHQALLVVYQTKENGNAKEGKLHVRAEMEKLGFEGSLHGSDYNEDTQPILDVLLSGGGIHFLNHAVYGAERKLISAMLRKLEGNQITRQHLVFAGPLVFGPYGLRKNRPEDILAMAYSVRHNDEVNLVERKYSDEQLLEIQQEKNSARVGGLRFQSLHHFVDSQRASLSNIATNRDYLLAARLLQNSQSMTSIYIHHPRLFFLHIRYRLKNHILFGGAAVINALPSPIFRILKKIPLKSFVKKVLKIN